MTVEEQGRRSGSGWLYFGGILVVVLAAALAFVLFTRQRNHVEAATQKLARDEKKGLSVEVAVAHKVAG